MKEKALAIKYTEGLPAPFVLAKGAGHLADTIVRLAEKAGVPLMRNADLTERLFYLEAGSFIPEECFEIVAQMLVYVHTICRGEQRSSATSPGCRGEQRSSATSPGERRLWNE